MTTYEDVHAGDLVLGHDGELWGVAAIARSPQLAVELVRHGLTLTGYPPAGTAVTVVARSDVSAEAAAAQMFIDRGIAPIEIISERWES